MTNRLYRASGVRDEKAVLWAHSGQNNFNERTVSAAAEIDLSIQKADKRTLDALGVQIDYDYIAVVFQEITEGSLIRVGALLDLPGTIDNLLEVKEYFELKNIQGKQTARYVTLDRFSGTLPTIA